MNATCTAITESCSALEFNLQCNLFEKPKRKHSFSIQSTSISSLPLSISSNTPKSISLPSTQPIQSPSYSNLYSNNTSDNDEYDSDSTQQSISEPDTKPISLDYNTLNCANDYDWINDTSDENEPILPKPQYYWPEQSDSEDEYYNLNETQIYEKIALKMSASNNKMIEHSNKLKITNTYSIPRDKNVFYPIRDQLTKHIQSDNYGHKRYETIIINSDNMSLDDIQKKFVNDVGHCPHTMQQLLCYCRNNKYKYKYIHIKKWWPNRPNQQSKPEEKAVNADDYC